jgi:hypothetical protein
MYQDPNSGQWVNDDGSPLYDYLPPGYGNYQAQADTPADAPPPPPAPGAGAPGAGTPEYAPPQFDGPYAPDYSFYEGAPGFDAPRFTPPPAFTAPTGDQVLNEPGYEFRKGEGERGIKAFASHLGALRTGGTIKDLLKYNQNFASQEYGNVYNRAADTYRTNYGVSRDVFDRTYQGAKDAFAPALQDWTLRTGLNKEAADDYFNRTYDAFKFGNDDAYRNKALAANQG